MKKQSNPAPPEGAKRPPPPPAPPPPRSPTGKAQKRRPEFEAYSKMLECIPTTWLDPLLTGSNKILPDGYSYSPKDIERLLQAIRQRMEKAAYS